MKRVRLFATIVCCAMLPTALPAQDVPQQVAFHIKLLEVDAEQLKAKMGVEELADYLNLEEGGLATPPGVVGVFADAKKVTPKLDGLCKLRIAKVLAEPTVVTMSGRPASFQSGGEVPIVVPQGASTQTIEFRPVGTKLEILPTAGTDGKLRVELQLEQNEHNGNDDNGVPKFRCCRMEMGVHMAPGQTVALLQNAKFADGPKQIVLFVTPECVKPLPAPRIECPLPVATPVRVPPPALRLPQPQVCIRPGPALGADHRIRKLTEAAASLREIGMHNEAAKLAAQADKVRRERQQFAAPAPYPFGDVRHDVRQLHNEVHQLRGEIKRLAELLERQVQDAPATARRPSPAAYHTPDAGSYHGWSPRVATPQELRAAVEKHHLLWFPDFPNRQPQPIGNDVESEPMSSVPHTQPQSWHSFSREPSEAERIEQRLKKKVALNLQSITLEDAVKRLAAEADVNVYLHKRGLEAEGVSPETQVWGRWSKPIAIRDILTKLLAPKNLTFVIENEVLKITSKFQAYPLSARAYSVGTLVIDPEGKIDFDPLIKKITNEIAPDFWEKQGGPAAIGGFESNLSLVVYQTDRAHDQIGHLINRLTVEARQKENAKSSSRKPSGEIDSFPWPYTY